MKNKMISSTIKHIVLLIIVCVIFIFSFFKIYNFIIENSLREDEKNYITINTDKYMVECLDYYFDDSFYHDGVTTTIYSPRIYLILRLRVTNTSKENITLTNNYKLNFSNKNENLTHGFNKYRVNIEPGKNVIADVAYLLNEYDENIKEYYIDFDGYQMKLNFD